jgi:hypothetical protein
MPTGRVAAPAVSSMSRARPSPPEALAASRRSRTPRKLSSALSSSRSWLAGRTRSDAAALRRNSLKPSVSAERIASSTSALTVPAGGKGGAAVGAGSGMLPRAERPEGRPAGLISVGASSQAGSSADAEPWPWAGRGREARRIWARSTGRRPVFTRPVIAASTSAGPAGEARTISARPSLSSAKVFRPFRKPANRSSALNDDPFPSPRTSGCRHPTPAARPDQRPECGSCSARSSRRGSVARCRAGRRPGSGSSRSR